MSVRLRSTPTGLAAGDHLCWPYSGADDLVATTRAYVAEGLARHELVTYLEVDARSLRHTVVADVDQVGRTAHARRPLLTPLTSEPWEPATDPRGPLEAMTRAAMAGGYTGLRLVSEVSAQVQDPELRPLWVRSEHLIDSFTVANPLTVLCCYDLDRIGRQPVAEVACVHALTRGALSPFALRAAPTGGVLALSGEVDNRSAEDLYRALVRVGPEAPSRVVVDVTELGFIDHTGLLAMDRAAQSLVASITLLGASRMVGWLVRTLGLCHVTAVEIP